MRIGNYEIKPGVDLSVVDLSHQDLQYVNLQGANLQNANLEGCNLKGSNLRYAKLENANLVNANLDKTDLEGANLQNARLENASFKGMMSSHETNFLGTVFDPNTSSSTNHNTRDLELEVQELRKYKELYEEIKSKMIL
jgi:uncharacterized protein YjbI with pentapeptide repeats